MEKMHLMQKINCNRSQRKHRNKEIVPFLMCAVVSNCILCATWKRHSCSMCSMNERERESERISIRGCYDSYFIDVHSFGLVLTFHRNVSTKYLVSVAERGYKSLNPSNSHPLLFRFCIQNVHDRAHAHTHKLPL